MSVSIFEGGCNVKDNLVLVFGMMAFFNRWFHSKNVKHYIFEPLRLQNLFFNIELFIIFVSNYNRDIKKLHSFCSSVH